VHLDEIEVLEGDVNLRDFASLGEAYSIGFILKFIEGELIFQYVNEKPVFFA